MGSSRDYAENYIYPDRSDPPGSVHLPVEEEKNLMANAKVNLSKLNFSTVENTFRIIKKYGKQHLPEILGVTGIGLSIYAKYLTAKEAIKADKAIAAEKERRKIEAEEDDIEPEELTRWETCKIWLEYCWPSMVVETGSIVCIGSAFKITAGKIMSMTMLYQAAKTEAQGLREGVVNRDGKAALHHIEHDMRKNRWDKENLDSGGIWETGKGNTLFIDLYTGAKFHSSISHVNTAITELNTMLQETQGYEACGYVELTDFLELLGESSRQRKCGKNACFRYNSPRDVIHPTQIVDWDDYADPTTGEPRVAFIDYEKFLTPSDDFIEKRPY